MHDISSIFEHSSVFARNPAQGSEVIANNQQLWAVSRSRRDIRSSKRKIYTGREC
ncbi:uncharacterized protein PHALS_10353 [Plasmopara halstedii]|uniref:Uncharacterized protein n=1 Tax=Plasmopara halstedii TaxID=4781 RepID=A0A0P1AGW5_PLAHL|nr:uncharacterized protein PHALS_10353 [Plasmopara halstedii]CEG40137.1 hypothetical protein PHALS_10353 [Plasmopara halstedii]|eukprot:XP_024576506.1 hypothetical protein PHALS_10353 [Plasmopara halstedii]